MSHNRLNELCDLSPLPDLCILDVSCNDIRDIEQVNHLRGNKKLELIHICGNPLDKIAGYKKLILSRLPSVKGIDLPDMNVTFACCPGTRSPGSAPRILLLAQLLPGSPGKRAQNTPIFVCRFFAWPLLMLHLHELRTRCRRYQTFPGISKYALQTQKICSTGAASR